MKKAFTLIEIILVVSIFSLLTSFTTINLLRPQNKASIDTATSQLVADLREQQIRAMVGDSEGQSSAQEFGIFFEPDGYTLFRGSAYSPAELTNFKVKLEDVTIGNINLPTPQIVFAKMTGETVNYSAALSSITMLHESSGISKTITVNRYGVTNTN